MSLNVRVVREGSQQATVHVGGRLDSETFGELESEILPFFSGLTKRLILDLEGLEYISSAGVRVVVKARKALRTNDGEVLVVNMQRQVAKVFKVIRAIPDSSVFQSIRELDRYLDAIQKKVLEEDD